MTLAGYRDPLDPVGSERGWMASIAPVRVLRGDGATLDTNWAILIQEEKKETLDPLSRLGSMFLYSALVALILAVLIIAGMWSIVLLVANAPGRLRSLKFWSRTATMHSQTSLSMSSRRSAGE
jgi:hypothetical protein